MKTSNFAACVGVLLFFMTPPVVAEEGLEDELTALVQSMNRLVEVLERQEKEQASDYGLRRVGLAVQILDIRARQQEALQVELRSLEDREQRTHGNIASNETRLENVKKQISESTDKMKKLELEARRDQLVVYLGNHKKQLQHYAQRRVDLEN